MKFTHFKMPRSLAIRLRELKQNKARYWETEGKKSAYQLYKYVVKTVPAYSKFLKDQGVDSKSVKSTDDFFKLPISDKSNYLRKYDYASLFPGSDLSQATTISATSGSSGDSFYFPRGEEEDDQYEYIAELFLKNQFNIDSKKTLGIIGFGLGIWIGGIFTYKILNKISSKGYDLTLAPVGGQLSIYCETIKKFGHLYDQIIIMGYPPYVKDIIDRGVEFGIKWTDYNVKIMTAAEEFSEHFRTYISKKSGIKNPLRDTLNMFGTVEMGTMAHETPLSNLIRKIAVFKPNVFKALFPRANRQPTLAQYYPEIVYFEEFSGEIIATGYGSSIPLIRYRFPDLGSVIPFEKMIDLLNNVGVDIMNEAKKHKIDKTIMRLPFVNIYARSDHSLIYRGANIYHDEIRRVLENRKIEKIISGRFTMVKREDKDANEYIELNIELKNGVMPSSAVVESMQHIVTESLRILNSEYNDQFQAIGQRAAPRIVLWPYKDPKYFDHAGKQKWTLRE